MLKRLIEKWEVFVYVGSLMISIGINWQMLNQVRSDVSDLQKEHESFIQEQRTQDLAIQKSALESASLTLRLTADEATSKADHDLVVGMAKQIDLIAKWVDKQGK